MLVLVLIGLLGGLITGISPCILAAPSLAGTSGRTPSSAAQRGRGDQIHGHHLSGADAELVPHFDARDVYLVLAGHGTVIATVSGSPTRTIKVSGTPNDHTVFTSSAERAGTLTLSLSPGLQAYDLTSG
jgi:hypothetical protein